MMISTSNLLFQGRKFSAIHVELLGSSKRRSIHQLQHPPSSRSQKSSSNMSNRALKGYRCGSFPLKKAVCLLDKYLEDFLTVGNSVKVSKSKNEGTTVDRRNPALPGMYNTL